MNKYLYCILLLLVFNTGLFSDQIKMAYLGVTQTNKQTFSIIFKIPTKSNYKLNIDVNFPKTCKNMDDRKLQVTKGAFLYSWNIQCKNSLLDESINITGLESTNISLLLQLNFLNKSSQTKILAKNNISYFIKKEPSAWQVVKTYTILGIEHILSGFDHLLFVLSLLLIVKNFRTLIWTITAFTFAHSITLGGVTFGFLKLPQQPVEAVIALSIMFLAMEIIHKKQDLEEGIASRFPWLVSFTFGLLHGFGFAGALAEIGLPEQSIATALIFFNVGVESGQIIFVSVVILIGFILKKIIQENSLQFLRTLMVYGIGSMASFWFIQRVSAF
jgi:hydrogenase/urease accessory protein HupE